MTLNMPSFRFPATVPLVSRSVMLREGEVIVMDGAQFEDDRRRIVIGENASDETVGALEKSLIEHEHIDGVRRWITDLLAPKAEGSE